MQITHVDALERTVQKTNEWLEQIQRELGARDRRHAYQALRATLHALRDRLPPDEVLDLAAQLPTLIRGVYLEGWRLAGKPTGERTPEEFLGAVRAASGDPTLDAEEAARAVFRVLAAKITSGEIRHVRQALPTKLRQLWPE